MVKKLFDAIGKAISNWKTTSAGFVAGLAILWPQIVLFQAHKPVDWNAVVLGVGTFLGLAMARDSGNGSDAPGSEHKL